MLSLIQLKKDNPSLDIRFNEPMSKHTSWAVGGPAEIFFMPKNVSQLKQVLSEVDGKLPVTWIGLGSNVLIRDKGVQGIVICTQKMDRFIRNDNGLVTVSCSLPCATLAKDGVENNYGPTLFFAGIPGTIGGALAMNAGANDHETWNYVSYVNTMDLSGNKQIRDKKEIDVSYRSAKLPNDECYLSAVFQFRHIDQSKDELKDTLRMRKEMQPIGEKSCGSVFMNPKDDYAGRLIESLGYKGFILGGARISEKHANFIINDGDATADDITSLIDMIAEAVYKKFKINLTPEVRVIGH
jgi:UDP-N-acetylmuramate dehydrogenase